MDRSDPRVVSLKAIFPDFDDAVIYSVLDSTDFDHDKALDVLLGMNDPSFIAPAQSPPSSQQHQYQSAPSADVQRRSQEALDEEFARRLALEEQQGAAQQPWSPQGPTMYQPYQPRRGGRSGWGSPPSQTRAQTQGQGGYTMSEFQDGFNRIAESGKKTFSSIVSKVKAKMQEFEQGQGWSGSQSPAPSSQPPQSGEAQYYPSQPRKLVQGAYAQPYYSSTPPQTGSTCPRPIYPSSPPRSGVLHPAAPEMTESQQPSYYDPNTRGYDLYGDDEEIQINEGTTHPARLPAATTATVGTSPSFTTPQPSIPTVADNSTGPTGPSSPPSFVTSPPPSYASPSPVSTIAHNPRLSSSSPPRSLTGTPTAGIGGRSTTPGAPGGVDFSKLGLLPKRPISLVQTQSPLAPTPNAPRIEATHSVSTTGSSTDIDEAHEAEFVENPFEDQ